MSVDAEMELEYALMKAPNECLNKTFRIAQKQVEKELAQVVSVVNDLTSGKQPVSKTDACNSLDKLVVKLQGLKRKLEESKREEENQIRCMQARLNLIKTHYKSEDAQLRVEWDAKRVDRVLVDYMLREGMYKSATQLAKAGDITNLVDIDIFAQSRKIVEGLSNCDCSSALQWCNDNRSKLKAIKSTLEFNLRIQEFIELVRVKSLPAAIAYARKHLAPHTATNLEEIQRAIATIAFYPEVKCSRYNVMFDSERWNDHIEQFKHDNTLLHNLTCSSLMNISLQAGISALKTSNCGSTDTQNINCPVCSNQFSVLGAGLPNALHTHSHLICRISGEVMNEDNPPLVLPNGYVYSKKALNEMARTNSGKITCPETNAVFGVEQLRKVFIT